MLQKARDLSGAGAWFLCVRVAEVGVLALLLAALMEARYAWQVGAQFSGNSPVDVGASPSLTQRITGMALFGGYRMPVSLLVLVLVLAALLLVLHRCQPVSHTRVLRWEWVTLWGIATLLALTATGVGVVALFAKDPFASPDLAVVDGSVGPGYREQVVSNLSWPLGALLLLLPLALWWARLPDMDDLEDALAETGGQPQGVGRTEGVGRPEAVGAAGTGALPRPHDGRPQDHAAAVGALTSGDGTRPGRLRRTTGTHSARDGDGDAIFVDEVEQIEPVERLQRRPQDDGDGSSSSGYDGYFRRQ